jgi:hypothetical protein
MHNIAQNPCTTRFKQDGIRTGSKGILKKNKADWGGCQQWAAPLFRQNAGQ